MRFVRFMLTVFPLNAISHCFLEMYYPNSQRLECDDGIEHIMGIVACVISFPILFPFGLILRLIQIIPWSGCDGLIRLCEFFRRQKAIIDKAATNTCDICDVAIPNDDYRCYDCQRFLRKHAKEIRPLYRKIKKLDKV